MREWNNILYRYLYFNVNTLIELVIRFQIEEKWILFSALFTPFPFFLPCNKYTVGYLVKYLFENLFVGGMNNCGEYSQLTFQYRIDIVSTLWINVKVMLIRCWKWNKIQRRIFIVAQSWYNFSARHWKNVKTTLHNVVQRRTTLFQRSLVVS